MRNSQFRAARRVSRRYQPGADAPPHLALAEALAGWGRLEDAIEVYEAVVHNDPRSAAALRGLARALVATGRPAEAFRRADAALALDARDGEAWRLVAESLEALGEVNLAAQAFARALGLGAGGVAVNLRLGRLHEALDRPREAAADYSRALQGRPSPEEAVEAHVALSGLFGRAYQFDEARQHGEAALALAPDSRPAHQNLAAIADHQGRLDDAEAHRERAFRGAPMIVTRAPRPRRRVLTLASAGRANSPDRYLVPTSRYDRIVWFLAYGEGARAQAYDVVFNAVADPDAAEALAAPLAAFAAASPKPLLNPPRAIAATARDRARELFAGVADLVTPLTRRVAAAADLEGLDDGLWLLRPLGSHGGERLERLGLADVAARLDGQESYLTAFRDYRSADGLFRKYRMFFVDRVAFPYHMGASDSWLVHYQTSQTPGRPDLIAEERAFLEDPEAALGARAYRAIAEVGRRMDLDFAGVDFSVLPDGSALLFEANATMFAHPEPPEGTLAHKNLYVERILQAFWARLERA